MPPFIISLDWCGLKAYARNFEDVGMLSKSFESKLFPFFTPKHGDVVIDVGAHIGRYTLFASNLVGGRGKVVSFEPDCSNFRILSMNIGLNKLRNVTLLPFAVGELDGETIFYLSSWTAFGSIIPSSKRRYSRLSVKIKKLDSLNLDRVDWIKIDVEGAEVSVLKGGMNLLKKHSPKLIVECFHDPSFFEVRSILEPLGYSINEILGLPLYIYAEPR